MIFCALVFVWVIWCKRMQRNFRFFGWYWWRVKECDGLYKFLSCGSAEV